jgi:hypothetical protein
MKITDKNIVEVLQSVQSGVHIPRPYLFIAYCDHCKAMADFDEGLCEHCGTLWFALRALDPEDLKQIAS